MSVDTIVYHGNCPDGWCAAFVLSQRYPSAKLVPATHGSKMDDSDFAGKDVIVADFSWKRGEVMRLSALCRSMVILDHHATAESELKGLSFCTFDMSRSGAQLAYDYQQGYVRERPWYVNYVADRDLWKWSLPHSREVSSYLMTLPHTIEAWSTLDRMDIQEAIALGKGALAQVDHYVEKVCNESYGGLWDGYSVSIANACYTNCSDVGSELCKRGADVGLVWFIRKDGQMQFSLRSTGGTDVSALALQYKGGGHKNAAGFQLEWFVGVSFLRGLTGGRL